MARIPSSTFEANTEFDRSQPIDFSLRLDPNSGVDALLAELSGVSAFETNLAS